jgi:hypothetical protein
MGLLTADFFDDYLDDEKVQELRVKMCSETVDIELFKKKPL